MCLLHLKGKATEVDGGLAVFVGARGQRLEVVCHSSSCRSTSLLIMEESPRKKAQSIFCTFIFM